MENKQDRSTADGASTLENTTVQVSVVFGGESPGNAGTKEALRRLQRLTMDVVRHHPSKAGVQFLFHVAGPVYTPSYIGLRTGPFRRANSQLEIQIAVPEKLDTPPNQYLATRLEHGLKLAESYFGKRKRSLSLEPVRKAVAEIAESLRG